MSQPLPPAPRKVHLQVAGLIALAIGVLAWIGLLLVVGPAATVLGSAVNTIVPLD